ncbi:MAG TPA: hypothetical protein VFQ45_09810 [Longimicrobium sp.]|nr:hypothetical protein [Longimicrobium sp.]
MTWDWKSAFDRKRRGPTKERLAIGGGVLALAVAVAAAAGAFGGDEGLEIVQGPAYAEEADVDEADEAAAEEEGGATPAATPAAQGPRRPPLEWRQGRAFAYLLPQGWQVIESDNGIELIAPDGITGVVGSIVLGAAGQASPEAYLRRNLASVGQGGARFVSVAAAEDWPGPAPGLVWKGIEAEIESRQDGRPTHVRATSHVLQGAGQYSAIVTGAQSPREQWDEVKDWLPRVRDAIRITNGAIPGQGMAAALPRGIRHDDVYGRFNDAWSARQVPATDLSQARREGTMGYVRLIDPETDRIWELPLEAYDPTVGGYRNPTKPDLLLRKAPD